MNNPAKPLSVLIVEDEGVIALDLAVLVEGLGYEVVGPVGSANDAFALVAERPVDLALVDLNLADGPSGAMLAQQLTSAHGIVVIFVTANPEMAAVAGHHELPVVRKPFDHATIAAALSSAWSQRTKP